MSHSPSHSQLLRTLAGPTRRTFLRSAATASLLPAIGRGAANVDVGIVGAGLAGLSCAWELKKAGVTATVYEASERAGGRCHSLRGFFPGQVAERGGELIDNLHKSMIGYAREFGLTLEDVGKMPGETFYYFDGVRIPEARVVEEYRAFVPAMRADLRRMSPEPTADKHTAADRELDYMSLRQYLLSRGASPVIRKVIEEAYVAEYGRSAEEQSCLGFLLFAHADRRSKFRPFGVFSDERYHIVEGNDAIAQGLAQRVTGQIRPAKQLVAATRTAAGRIALQFTTGPVVEHDAVVLTLPFSVLRTVDLSGLQLPSWKRKAIDELGYGDNAKMMIGFTQPYWRQLGGDGASYSDLMNHQATWETNPTRAAASRAVLTDYSGAERGRDLHLEPLQQVALKFLNALDIVMPGVYGYARQTNAGVQAFLEHWPSNALSRGSYTCYLPGQFTSIAGLEGKPVGNVFFAGEHTNSFYEWQGFMEGALLSGVAAAKAISRGGR